MEGSPKGPIKENAVVFLNTRSPVSPNVLYLSTTKQTYQVIKTNISYIQKVRLPSLVVGMTKSS